MHPREATVSLRENGRVDIDLYAGPPDHLADELKKRSNSGSESAKERLDRDIADARECIGGNLIFDPETYELRLSIRDQTERQVENRLKCTDGLDQLVELDIDTEEGWLWDTVSVNLDLWFEDGGLGANKELLVAHPDYITFEFPKNGSVEIINQSDSLETELDGDETSAISVIFSTDSDGLTRMAARRNKDRDCEQPSFKKRIVCPVKDPYYSNVKIKSYYRKANYSLNDVLVLFSIVFGSGIAVTWFSRLSQKRNQ